MEDAKKIAERVGKDLNKMMRLLDRTLKDIPSEHSDIIVDAQKDVNVVLKSVKKNAF